MATSKPIGLTAAQFFERKLAGFSKTNAQNGTIPPLSYSAIIDATDPEKAPRRDTLVRLQAWSLAAVPEHGVYISAAKTLGLAEPTDVEIRKAAGE